MIVREDRRSPTDLCEFVREAQAVDGDVAALLRLVGEARPLFAASDVSVAVHDPRVEVASAGRPWFAAGLPGGLAACLRDPMEGHLPLRALRRLGLSAARVDQLPGRMSDYGRGSAYARTLAATGRTRVLIGHVGDRQSLGRVEWYRNAEEPPFEEQDETRLRLILPALSDAFRALVRSTGPEVALVNAAGLVLWATDGFRFRWNAASLASIRDGRLPLAAMLDDPLFSRPIALQVLNLADPMGAAAIQEAQGLAGERGHGIPAKWTPLPGGPYGCVGRVMLLELGQSVGATLVTPQPSSTRPSIATHRIP